MTDSEMLNLHVAEYKTICDAIEKIMLTPNYDNEESAEMMELKKKFSRSIQRTFKLKQAVSHAESLVAPK